jgi:hypothetical protein
MDTPRRPFQIGDEAKSTLLDCVVVVIEPEDADGVVTVQVNDIATRVHADDLTLIKPVRSE